MDADQIREAVHELFSQGDATILDYICGILEDEHFEFGEDGEEAYESIGPFLVSTGRAEHGGHDTHASDGVPTHTFLWDEIPCIWSCGTLADWLARYRWTAAAAAARRMPETAAGG